MKVQKVFLNNVELSEEKAQEKYEQYVTTHIANECFFGGIAIETPEGILQAEVALN